MTKKLLINLVQFFILVSLCYYLFTIRATFDIVYDVNYNWLFLVSFGVLCNNLIKTFQLKEYLALISDKRLKKLHLFLILISGSLLNYLPLNIGTIFKAKLLKKNMDLSYSYFVSFSALDAGLKIVSSFSLGILVMPFFWQYLNDNSLIIFSLFSFLIIVGIISFILLSGIWIPEGKGFISSTLKEIILGLKEMTKSFNTFITLYIYTTIQLIIMSCLFQFAFLSLNVKISFFVSILFSISSTALLLINFTPGNLGIRESFIGLLSLAMGQNFEVGFIASSVVRIGGVICHIIFGSIGLFYFKIKKMV